MNKKYRIFISSPIWKFENFRQAILDSAKLLRETGRFELFFYEEHCHKAVEGKTITEVICDNSGQTYDAMFVAFQNRVGQGTLDELSYFENTIKSMNASADLWWCQVFCGDLEDETTDFRHRLVNHHGTELPIFDGQLVVERPSQLADRFAAHAMRLIGEWLKSE